jgi:hypothetical protein
MERRAHPPSGGARWNSETRCPGSLGALGSPSLRVASATGPPASGRRSGWTSSEAHVRNLLRNATPGRGSAAKSVLRGRRGTVRIHRRSLEASRLRSEGLRTGYDFGSSASSPLRRSADGRTGIGVVFQPVPGNNPLIGISSELLGLAHRLGRSRTYLLSSCVLCPMWAHPSGRNHRRQRAQLPRVLRDAPAHVQRAHPGAKDHCLRHLRVARAAAPSTQPGATVHDLRHLRVARVAVPSAQPGTTDHRLRHLRMATAAVPSIHPGATDHRLRHLRMATTVAPSTQSGATDHRLRHLRMATTVAPSTQPGTMDTDSLSFGRAKPGWERLTGCAGSSPHTPRSVEARCSA